MNDIVDHTLSKTVGKIFARSQKDTQALEEYRNTINKIDDFFEYANESTKDRQKIHELLDKLAAKLRTIYND